MATNPIDQFESLSTLYEWEPAAGEALPATLARAYDGGLIFPPATTRPYVIANFVETIDGVVSYSSAPGQAGGGAISGESVADHLLMGLLRAYADVVIFGAGSLREDRGHVRTPAFIFPPYADAYRELRQSLGKPTPLPLNLIMSASGELDLDEPTFHTPGLNVVIATTPAGAEHLAMRRLPDGVEARVVTPGGSENASGVDPLATLDLLANEYGIRLALTEGGPRVLASFVAHGALDELFLTFAPQLAGRDDHSRRLALLEGMAFTPTHAPWARLLSVKRAGSHLMLRYRLSAQP